MALSEVKKAPSPSEINNLKRRLRKLEQKYDDLKYQFKDHIDKEDFEVINVDDFLELKELYILKKQLYWKIHALENPNDTATPEAYKFLNSMSWNEQIDFLTKHGMTTHDLIHAIEENPNFLDEVTA